MGTYYNAFIAFCDNEVGHVIKLLLPFGSLYVSCEVCP
jgi:hypothetical protein